MECIHTGGYIVLPPTGDTVHLHKWAGEQQLRELVEWFS